MEIKEKNNVNITWTSKYLSFKEPLSVFTDEHIFFITSFYQILKK